MGGGDGGAGDCGSGDSDGGGISMECYAFYFNPHNEMKRLDRICMCVCVCSVGLFELSISSASNKGMPAYH